MALPQNDNLINATSESITTYSANWSLGLGAYNVTPAGGTGESVGTSIAFDNSNSYPNNQYAQATIANNGSNYNGPAVRCNASSGGNCYAFRVSISSEEYAVIKLVNGTFTNISGTISNTFLIGDSLLLTVSGTTLSAYQNGNLLYTTTDSSLTAGSAGVSGNGVAGPALTSWQGGAMPRVLTLSGAVGTYAYTGGVAGLLLPNNYTLLLQPGLYTYIGGNSQSGYALTANAGVYAYVGGAATLTNSGQNAYVLPAAAGIYAYAGGIASLTYSPAVYPGSGGIPSPCRVIIPGKRLAEVIAPPFDFTSRFQPGETITSTQVVVSVWSGNDPNPSLVYGGVATVNGLVVSPKLQRGVVGVIYVVQVIATGSISGPAELDALLAILPTGI